MCKLCFLQAVGSLFVRQCSVHTKPSSFQSSLSFQLAPYFVPKFSSTRKLTRAAHSTCSSAAIAGSPTSPFSVVFLTTLFLNLIKGTAPQNPFLSTPFFLQKACSLSVQWHTVHTKHFSRWSSLKVWISSNIILICSDTSVLSLNNTKRLSFIRFYWKKARHYVVVSHVLPFRRL